MASVSGGIADDGDGPDWRTDEMMDLVVGSKGFSDATVRQGSDREEEEDELVWLDRWIAGGGCTDIADEDGGGLLGLARRRVRFRPL